MSDDTPAVRLPDLRAELEKFNTWRRSLLRGQPIDREEGMPLERSGTGGDVE